MSSPYNHYFTSLYKTVLQGMNINEAPLAFAERINQAIQPYLKNEYQRPEPPLHEV